MWYLAELLFAQPPQSARTSYQCESCNVVFCTESAIEAYRKAITWGIAYADEPPAGMRLLGVSHLTRIGEELHDGTEICGRFFEAPKVWESLSDLIPPPGELKAVQWERNDDTPIEDLFDPKQIAQLKRAWGQPTD